MAALINDTLRRSVPAVTGRPRWPMLPPLARRKEPLSGSSDDEGLSSPWRPHTLVGHVSVVALHLVPGLLAYGLLRTAREPLQRVLGISSAEAQIGIIMTAVMLAMLVATFVFARALDGLAPREVIQRVGLSTFDLVGVLMAVAIWLIVVAVPSIVDYEDELRSLVERVDWLALPSWHFQRIDGFQQLPAAVGGFALVANVVCEEVWFRGYLQHKLGFLGSVSWMGGGVLFTLYHVFEAPIAIPASSAASPLPPSGV